MRDVGHRSSVIGHRFVLQRAPERHCALDFFVAEGTVRGDTAGVVDFDIAGDLCVTQFERARFGCFDQGTSHPAPLPRWLHVPPFNEWDRGREAVWRVLAEIEFEESNQLLVLFRDEYDWSITAGREVLSRFDLVVPE